MDCRRGRQQDTADLTQTIHMAEERIKISELAKAPVVRSGAVALGINEAGGEAMQLPIGYELDKISSYINSLRTSKADKSAATSMADSLATLSNRVDGKADKTVVAQMQGYVRDLQEEVQELKRRINAMQQG